MSIRAAVAVASLLAVQSVAATAQEPLALGIERGDGGASRVPVIFERGYAVIPVSLLGDLGWAVEEEVGGTTLSIPGGIEIALRLGTPFFRWNGTDLQLVEAPYRDGGRTLVPLQLLTDFLPRRLPDLYEFRGGDFVLRAGDPEAVGAGAAPDAAADSVAALPPPELAGPSPYEGPRVVIIDAGHGGADPGALGPAGIREKDIALGIALGLAEILESDPELEVHLTRDGDEFVDLWERGEVATEIKGERPGLFVSIHANSFPDRRRARGFETYFLSEARTEHERRVSAIENAPLSFQGQSLDPDAEPDLGFILRELRNLDHQHWSSLLAEMVQEELNGFHPGPNRGVKQGVLAVLTNAIMPSILVETGYLSNEDEARLLGQASFQREAAEALARAIDRFFDRYPPGSGNGGMQGGQ